jgi:hypothetical protein
MFLTRAGIDPLSSLHHHLLPACMAPFLHNFLHLLRPLLTSLVSKRVILRTYMGIALIYFDECRFIKFHGHGKVKEAAQSEA